MITPAEIAVRATGYWSAKALITAVEMGLFDAIQGGATRATLAGEMGTSERGALTLLDAMVTAGLVTERDGLLAVADGAGELLTTAASKSMAAALAYNNHLYNLWGELGSAVRAGQPIVPARAHLGQNAEETRAFVMGMHGRAVLTIAALAGLDLSDARRLLDLGSGPGTVGRYLAGRFAHLHVVLADLPGITVVARGLTAGQPAAGRVEHRELDYRSGSIPDMFDTVLWCGALHQHTPEETRSLLGRIAASGASRLITVDYLIDADDVTGAASEFAALFGLNMSLFSATAHMYRLGEYGALLKEAGWRVAGSTTAAGHYRIVEARR